MLYRNFFSLCIFIQNIFFGVGERVQHWNLDFLSVSDVPVIEWASFNFWVDFEVWLFIGWKEVQIWNFDFLSSMQIWELVIYMDY